MKIQHIADKALKDGFLTPAMEFEVNKIVDSDSASQLSLEEYLALDQIMRGLLEGEIVCRSRKQFINVMEQLVLEEASVRVAEMQPLTDSKLDIGDIAGYALNRLPPLYATTSQGAEYQRQLASVELQPSIARAISMGIERYQQRPESRGELIGKVGQSGEITKQITNLLQSHATNYEV